MLTEATAAPSMRAWRPCPTCALLQAQHAPCRHVRLPDDALPRAPLVLLILVSALLGLGGAVVGLVWVAWVWGGK